LGGTEGAPDATKKLLGDPFWQVNFRLHEGRKKERKKDEEPAVWAGSIDHMNRSGSWTAPFQ